MLARVTIFAPTVTSADSVHYKCCLFQDLYASPITTRVIKSKTMRWAGRVARMEDKRGDTGVWWENLMEGSHLKDVGLNERIILKWIFEKRSEGTDWIDLAQDANRWRALVNTVMNLRVLLNAENFLSS